jgi:hypothetical protein
VLEINVVVRALPFHCTDEVFTKFLPVTAIVKLVPPATAELGLSNVMIGGGCLIVNVKGAEVPPPGVGLNTVTAAVPTALTSAAVIAARKAVWDTKVVVRAAPFHCTVDADMKFDPVTINVNAGSPANAELGIKDPITGAGLLTVKVNAEVVPPPGVGLNTVTMFVPPVATSAAVIAACNVVLETNVVARAPTFH